MKQLRMILLALVLLIPVRNKAADTEFFIKNFGSFARLAGIAVAGYAFFKFLTYRPSYKIEKDKVDLATTKIINAGNGIVLPTEAEKIVSNIIDHKPAYDSLDLMPKKPLLIVFSPIESDSGLISFLIAQNENRLNILVKTTEARIIRDLYFDADGLCESAQNIYSKSLAGWEHEMRMTSRYNSNSTQTFQELYMDRFDDLSNAYKPRFFNFDKSQAQEPFYKEVFKN